MCRPSCCTSSSRNSGGTGLAVIAILIAAAIVAAKIGPTLAEIGRVALDVAGIAALTAVSVLVLAAAIWLAIRLTRRYRHRRVQRQAARIPAAHTTGFVPVSEQSCLACGARGQVVRIIGTSAVQVRPCPECQPTRLMG
jgi:hypothetical protein